MNSRLLTVLICTASMMACQASTDAVTTDASAEVAETITNSGQASNVPASASGGPKGKDSVPATDVSENSTLPLDARACSQLPQKTFQSVAQYEMGRSPGGIVKGHWVIGFDQSKFRWRYSDVVEMGDYQCADGRITFLTALGEPRANGSFNSELGKLIVDGIEYALQP